MVNSCKYEGNEPFKKFKSVASLELDDKPAKILPWYKDLLEKDVKSFSGDELTRAYLKKACGNKSITDSECLKLILAWGCGSDVNVLGQHKEFFENPEGKEWQEHAERIIKELRAGLPSLDAYKKFYDLKNQGEDKIKYLGVAFFTKLIFFCNPNHDGYIMDQFVGKSVNLIMGKEIVIIKNDGTVDKKNKRCSYENFCNAINCIAKSLDDGWTGCMVEMNLHSHPDWRPYVKDKYPTAKLNEGDPCTCNNGDVK